VAANPRTGVRSRRLISREVRGVMGAGAAARIG
jgi:hypothetical protein